MIVVASTGGFRYQVEPWAFAAIASQCLQLPFGTADVALPSLGKHHSSGGVTAAGREARSCWPRHLCAFHTHLTCRECAFTLCAGCTCATVFDKPDDPSVYCRGVGYRLSVVEWPSSIPEGLRRAESHRRLAAAVSATPVPLDELSAEKAGVGMPRLDGLVRAGRVALLLYRQWPMRCCWLLL